MKAFELWAFLMIIGTTALAIGNCVGIEALEAACSCQEEQP